MLFLAEARSKLFTYYYLWQTCYVRHLRNSPGSIHTLQGATGNLGTIAISVYCQVLIFGWVNRGTIVVAHAGQFLMSKVAPVGLKPTILWLGVRRTYHLAIAAQCLRRSLINAQAHHNSRPQPLSSISHWSVHHTKIAVMKQLDTSILAANCLLSFWLHGS